MKVKHITIVTCDKCKVETLELETPFNIHGAVSIRVLDGEVKKKGWHYIDDDYYCPKCFKGVVK